MAKAAGINRMWKARNEAEPGTIFGRLKKGPHFVHVMCKPESAMVKIIQLTHHEIRDRFVAALKQ